MNMSIVNNEESFCNIADSWEKLYQEIPYVTPYQDWDWNYLYWKYLKGKKQLQIFVYDRDAAVVAIFPMWTREQMDLLVMEPIGTRGTDYIHLLLKTDFANEAIDRFFQWFIHSEIDILNIGDMPDDAFYMKALMATAEEYGLISRFDSKYCPCFDIELPDKWESYIETLSTRQKSDIGYYRRYANRNAESIAYVRGASSDMKKHFQLHQEVRRAKGDKGAYKNTLVQELITDYAVSLEKKGLFELVFLEIDHIPCATILGIEKGSTRFNMTIGHDPSFSKLRPGTLLYGYDIEKCIQKQIKKYDLSRGPDSYKYKMGAALKYNTRLVIGRSEESVQQYLENQHLYWENEDYAPTEK